MLDRPASRLTQRTSRPSGAARAKPKPGPQQLARARSDDKILTSVECPRASPASRGPRVELDDTALIVLADNALLDFLYQSARRHGCLYASAGAALPAYLTTTGLPCSYFPGPSRRNAAGKDRDLAWAIALADAVLQRFQDRERGGFFFTAHDHENLRSSARNRGPMKDSFRHRRSRISCRPWRSAICSANRAIWMLPNAPCVRHIPQCNKCRKDARACCARRTTSRIRARMLSFALPTGPRKPHGKMRCVQSRRPRMYAPSRPTRVPCPASWARRHIGRAASLTFVKA